MVEWVLVRPRVRADGSAPDVRARPPGKSKAFFNFATSAPHGLRDRNGVFTEHLVTKCKISRSS